MQVICKKWTDLVSDRDVYVQEQRNVEIWNRFEVLSKRYFEWIAITKKKMTEIEKSMSVSKIQFFDSCLEELAVSLMDMCDDLLNLVKAKYVMSCAIWYHLYNV